MKDEDVMTMEEAFPGDNNLILKQIQVASAPELLKDLLTRATEKHRYLEESIITDKDFLDWIRDGYKCADEELGAFTWTGYVLINR